MVSWTTGLHFSFLVSILFGSLDLDLGFGGGLSMYCCLVYVNITSRS